MIKKSNKTWLVGLTIVILSLTVGLVLRGCTQKEGGSGNVIILKTFRDTLPRYFFAPHYVYMMTVPSGDFTEKIPRGLGDEPRWSKDGKWIVFSTIRVDDLEDSEIYIMRSEGGKRIQLTKTDIGRAQSPTWSPSGKEIAYVGNGNIYILDVSCILSTENESACQLSPILLTERGRQPDWSSVDDQIVFADSLGRIFIIDTDTRQTHEITPSGEVRCQDPRWSPNGESIVLECKGNFYILASDGSVKKVLLRGEFGGGGMPSWSPDGQSIVFVGSLDNDLESHGLGWEGSIPANALYMIDINGNNLVRLTHESQENIMWYSWMP